jgi:hypothetical protein
VRGSRASEHGSGNPNNAGLIHEQRHDYGGVILKGTPAVDRGAFSAPRRVPHSRRLSRKENCV